MVGKENGWKAIPMRKHIANVSASGRQIIVASTRNHDDEELKTITAEYEEERHKKRPWLQPLLGKFRWCRNYPKCGNAFYARPDKVRDDKGWYCSRSCFSTRLRPQDIEFLRWFRDLTDSGDFTSLNRAAEWIVDTTHSRDPERLSYLSMLVEREPARVKEVRKRIRSAPKANWIVSEFEKTKEGEKLRSLVE